MIGIEVVGRRGRREETQRQRYRRVDAPGISRYAMSWRGHNDFSMPPQADQGAHMPT